MSIIVNLVTPKRAEKKVLLENLQSIYAPIYCLGISEDIPTVRFGVFMRSNRGIEVTETDEYTQVRFSFFQVSFSAVSQPQNISAIYFLSLAKLITISETEIKNRHNKQTRYPCKFSCIS